MKAENCSVCGKALDPNRLYPDLHFDDMGKECHEACCSICKEGQKIVETLIEELGL